MSSLRKADLTNTDWHGKAVDPLTHPMQNPIAKEAPAHSSSTDNPMSEYSTTFSKPGKLGGTGQAGK
jgi:hypothetical protein